MAKKWSCFFPRADTPSCINEAEQFSTLHDEFIAHHTVVIGVSKGTPTKQATFRAKYDLTCKLGADHETSFCEEFGVSDARQKATATRHLVAAWKDTTLKLSDQRPPPDRPGRPEHPLLRPPREVPRRRITQSTSGRIALLHAIAHIELNAVDLALDLASRSTKMQLPLDFYHDWISVADDEARHFLMLSDRLADLEAACGDLPAHNGLWQAADATKHDLLARLSIAPLVLEARGLDVTPTMIDRLKSVVDEETANVLSIIMTDEITHISIGKRWFD